VYEQILQLYPDESLQKKKAAKLEPMTIPRRRRPAAFPSCGANPVAMPMAVRLAVACAG